MRRSCTSIARRRTHAPSISASHAVSCAVLIEKVLCLEREGALRENAMVTISRRRRGIGVTARPLYGLSLSVLHLDRDVLDYKRVSSLSALFVRMCAQLLNHVCSLDCVNGGPRMSDSELRGLASAARPGQRCPAYGYLTSLKSPRTCILNAHILRPR